MKQKLIDTTRLNATGWSPRITLRTGLELTYRYYIENITAE
jgi:GDP-L-fucose synthase